jgi:hypothetical protein
MKAIHLLRILIFGIVALIVSMCKEVDDIPPVITLIGPDSVLHILNEPYVDQGAKALDETEGDITSKLFVKVNVNENKAGDYLVNFRAVDESGNEAMPVDRFVRVYNTAFGYSGTYAASEKQVLAGQMECNFITHVGIDSTFNNRIVFHGFSCDTLLQCYADIYDTIIVIPFQTFSLSKFDLSLQGSGWLNDSVMNIDYSQKTEDETTYWNVVFER